MYRRPVRGLIAIEPCADRPTSVITIRLVSPSIVVSFELGDSTCTLFLVSSTAIPHAGSGMPIRIVERVVPSITVTTPPV